MCTALQTISSRRKTAGFHWTLAHPVLSPDAAKCSPSTDAGLTPIAVPGTLIDSISDDRLFTVAEVAALLNVRKSDVYSACDRGGLRYVKFEGIVQVEGRDLKAWLG
jgi:excisionase family DNA binding protein